VRTERRDAAVGVVFVDALVSSTPDVALLGVVDSIDRVTGSARVDRIVSVAAGA
jgi:hypothetical protein